MNRARLVMVEVVAGPLYMLILVASLWVLLRGGQRQRALGRGSRRGSGAAAPALG